MPITIGVVKETFPEERRVALTPNAVTQLKKAALEPLIENGAGAAAGFPDAAYAEAGATLLPAREEIFRRADIIVQVRALGANPDRWSSDLALMREGQTLIALVEPLAAPDPVRAAAERGLTTFALELIPRITRAQTMDVLSSQANLAGYKAVIIAAQLLPKIFPMMMTAAGTITPARLFVIGAGVAGLQAIATARRLGAVVSAYDVRPAVREQIESLGARFVELPLEARDAQDASGYARAMDEEFYRRQAELLGDVIAEQDVVISTAAVPGQRAPLLITRPMVERMAPGSVIVDLAAERGGNCELTRPGEIIQHRGVYISGPLNLPATLPFHASQLFARNVAAFILNLIRNGQIDPTADDQIVAETLVTYAGQVVHQRVRQKLGLAA
ncbi:Re/Si-specific NAD(P)(+) transhydrogenase subunit alpha [Pyrinomonas methylaliphatogenes]|uniref:NAD(P) transhydrogenase subunit alpha part 1 n=1 Tax=Pyrinomonas methylaliphatogenes TaxID=454194 RepID=A0A0B6WU75_9BACT|nr:Re/Si-specific NAD(P)(+) transhydrogenase subunit alpha [Pyrinomonas methylaliphatogenes]MBX5479414.1 Re/Si-specific NAD(P)(+) transhydrogenase subunit alpha [Pyrinomonas methylaliphatogenes]CDM64788.1 NAD/NADP transhydrogenase alpha subunit [Pyrinomonas methylaliphatogenes]